MGPVTKKLTCLKDYEEAAREILSRRPHGPLIWQYYSQGAGDQRSLKENEDAFKRLQFLPRILVDVSKRDQRTTLQGQLVPSPIGIAPSSVHKMAHPMGELATVKGAAKHGHCLVLSTYANTSLEDIASSSIDCLKWFQLYIMNDANSNIARGFASDLIKRAEAAGYKALVLTVDLPVLGNRRVEREGDIDNVPLANDLPNFAKVKSPTLSASLIGSEESASSPTGLNPSVTWDIISWMKTITRLPIILKGILHPEDAKLAVKHGASGIWISNHGGRQLDSLLAPIDALPGIKEAVKDDIELYLDGGVRSGSDVVKAIALGARAVFVGRPALWGLICGGEDGVANVLKILRDEMDTAMALLGYTSLEEITKDCLFRNPMFKSNL
ncbi:unnamed protein product [Owenia fusiformis]|uniref:(S)-2-hydroxy-acid oxidase n=1 Tax=Owenia fusiformis TaxID=6347 RepID=A0A8S4P0F6_OWEFU|nr:unnamed protein product [Owenia fusiformis]